MKRRSQRAMPGTLHATWIRASESPTAAPHLSHLHDVSPQLPATSLFSEEATAMQRNWQRDVLPHGTTRSLPDHHQKHLHYHHHHPHYNGQYSATGRRIHSMQAYKHLTAPHRFLSAGGIWMQQAAVAIERKEDAVSFFDIKMDQSPFYQYRPGEEISGAVHMDIRRSLEIRFVELLIVGEGAITVVRPKQSMTSSLKETYLSKKTFLIGTNDASWTSVLTPGHYLSRFRFCLPKDLPSSITHDDLSCGFTLNINYYIKAHICNDLGSASVRSTSSTNLLMKVLVSTIHPFRVQRHFDINLVRNAYVPVHHTEEIAMSCVGRSAMHVTLNLERTVFLAGDDIKMRLSTATPPPQHIKSVACQLLLQLRLDHQAETCTFTISNVEMKDPQVISQKEGLATYNMTIPTHTNLVSSFMHGCTMVHLAYCLAIEVRLAPGGGKLSLVVPLAIGPCAEPIYTDKISSRKAVPIFNRPTRFPFFSPSQGENLHLPAQSSHRSQSARVVTKYRNSFWSQCLLCCSAATISD